MTANIDIDRKLLDEALKLGHFRTKRAAVSAALAEYVLFRKQKQMVELFGRIDFDPLCAYESERQRAEGMCR
jgi:hypothetical protein